MEAATGGFLKVLTNFSKFTGILNTLIQVFSCGFSEICTNTFFTKTFERLVLYLEPDQTSMIELFCGNSKS